jgi:hypothetical protein
MNIQNEIGSSVESISTPIWRLVCDSVGVSVWDSTGMYVCGPVNFSVEISVLSNIKREIWDYEYR